MVAGEKVCKIQEIEGKGRGLVATKSAESGSLIIKEKALLVLARDQATEAGVKSELSKLSKKDKNRIFGLRGKAEGSSTVRDKFLNNAINTDGEDFGLFPTIAIINHSCCPNAVWGSTEKPSELEVRVTEPVKEGDEVTVNYIGDRCLLLTPGQRQEILEATWGFRCCCQACSEDKDEPVRLLLAQLQPRLRAALCSSNFELLYKLHTTKQAALGRMVAKNTQQLLDSAQLQPLIALFANEPPARIEQHFEDWKKLIARDGLQESRAAFEDMNQSFENGAVRHQEEFWEAGAKPRDEWIKWIYPKL